MAGLSCHSLRNSILLVHLLLHFSETQLIGPKQPIIAAAGEDVTLPCHLVQVENVATKTLEWTRSDLDPRFVVVWRAGQDFINLKNPAYKGRSSLFTDELKHGNISLKLSKVKPADEGRYRCFIPDRNEEVFIDLIVASGAVSSPVIIIDRDEVGVILECKSEGWHPKPEVHWLDFKGNLLSAGPTETPKGPDDLYSVSSRVTVEKKCGNNFTCRVEQKNINQSRETHIQISDDFMVTPSSGTPVIVGLAVSLALSIMFILIGVFFIWRQNKTKVKGEHCDESEEQKMMNRSKNDKTATEQEQENLMTQDIAPTLRNCSNEEQRRKEAENEAESMRKKVDRLMAEVEKLKEEKQQLQHLLDAKEQKHKPSLGRGEKLMYLNTATTGSELEKNQETDKKLKDTEELNQQLEKKDAEIRDLKKQLDKNQEAEKEMKEEIGKLKFQLERKSSHDKNTVKQLVKLKETEELNQQLEKKDAEIRELKKQLDKNQEADKMMKEEIGKLRKELERKSSRDKDTVKHSESSKLNNPQPEQSQRHFQEQNQSSSANRSSMRCDIILEELDRQGNYLCLKNNSREDKFLGGWELKLQINKNQSRTYKFKENYTLKARRALILRRPATRNPHTDNDDLMWIDLDDWSPEENQKISLISNTGEKHRLK